MKITLLNGKIVPISLKFIKNEEFKSELESETYDFLKKRFQFNKIIYQFIIPETHGMSLDFFIPDRMIAVECDGAQHLKYSKYFHGSHKNFVAQKTRDNNKRLFCKINNITLYNVIDVSELKSQIK